jgi:ankyrin repeat protein
VRLLPGQLQLQVWTPLFPDGETESSTVRVQRYALKKSSGGAVDLVPLNEEKYKELRDRLFKAARRGDITLVKRLLEGEGEIISKNHLLLVAAQAGESIESADHKELLGLFLEKGANVNYQNPPNGFTALICCTAAGHRDCVKMLLSKGADTKLKDKNKRTALAMAVRNGSKEMVELLLANGVDPAEESPETLLYAIDSGKDEIAKLLIAKGGATLKGYTGDYAYTPLTRAAEKGLLPLVRSMLLHDADVNEQDGEEKTALIRAADKGEAGVARFLIANAAKLNLKDEDGNTALMLAAQRADIEIVQLLIDEGAYLQARNSDGENALDLVKVGSKRERARKSMWGGDFATPAYQNDTALLGEFAKVDELLRKALANH